MDSLKESFSHFLTNNDYFVRKLLVYMVNNRIQEFDDPLTRTLVLLATSALQPVFCESGLIFFKTAHLPIFPYTCLLPSEKKQFKAWVDHSSEAQESCDSSGQFSLALSMVPKQPLLYMCKRTLLSNFVYVMRLNNGSFHDALICNTLCNIILQRFVASVPVSSDIINSIMAQLSMQAPYPQASLCPLLRQPSDVHFAIDSSHVVHVPTRKRPPAPSSSTSYKKNKPSAA